MPPASRVYFQASAARMRYGTGNCNGPPMTASLGATCLSHPHWRERFQMFTRQFIQHPGKDVVLAPGLSNRLLNGYVEAMPFEAALDKIAFANSLKLSKTKDNAFLLQPESDPQTGAAGGVHSNFPPNQARSSMPAGLSIEIQAGEGGRKSIQLTQSISLSRSSFTKCRIGWASITFFFRNPRAIRLPG